MAKLAMLHAPMIDAGFLMSDPKDDLERALADLQEQSKGVYLCSLGGAKIQHVRRPWVERLFSWPWRPWVASKIKISGARIGRTL